MADTTRGWLILRPDLTPDWKAFYAYWMRERSAAERMSRQAGGQAFQAQQAAAFVLLEAAWAEQERVAEVRRAELRHERQAASRERRRRYNAAWMRDYRARARTNP
jgi:hypothetical protein